MGLLPFSTPLLPFPFPEPSLGWFAAPLPKLSGTSSSSLILQLSEGRGGLSPCPVPPVLFPDPLLRPSGMLSSLPLWLLLLPFSTPLLLSPWLEPSPALLPAPLPRLSGTSNSLPLLQLPEGRRGPSPCPEPSPD